MSEITNVILTTESCEDEPLAEFQRLMFPHEETGLVNCRDKRFNPPWYGGDKYLEVDIYLGAFREFDVDRAIAALRQARWIEPESVKLYISRGRHQRFAEVVWQDPADVAADTSDEED
jgi:hypothetical protein